MTFSAYIRYVIWDFLLVFAASAALSYTLLNGFYIDPSLQYSVLPAAIAAIVLLALYLVAFNRRTLRLGSFVFAFAALAALVASAALSGTYLLEDTESNYFIFAMVCILVPTIAFLLTRKRGGTAVLFIAGVFACSWIQFFYERYELLWMFVFLASSLALIVYKNYQLSARSATTVGKLSFTAGFGVALATVVVAVGLGSAVWFGIIAPLDPQALQIKLITEVRALETLPVQGSDDEYLTPRMDLTSDQTNSDERTTDDLQQGEDGRPEPARPRDETQVQEEQSGSTIGFDLDSITEAFNVESNFPQAWVLWALVFLIPLAIIAYFVGRRLYRSHRLKRMESLAPAQRVCVMYKFVMGKLPKVGFSMPAGLTVLEFANSTKGQMQRMDAMTGASFSSITDVYASVVYGKQEPTSDQLRLFSQYYRGFWKAARAQLGNVKYFFRSFAL